MRGVIWFQADGNAGHPEEYGELIKALVTSWRANFHRTHAPSRTSARLRQLSSSALARVNYGRVEPLQDRY